MTVGVRVAVKPASASISIDGQPLGTGAFVGTLPKDGARHELEIKAPGYKTFTDTIDVSSDISRDVELERLPTATVTAAPQKIAPVGPKGTGKPHTGGGSQQPAQPATATPPTSTAPDLGY
jgi:hypothetical protein